MKVLFNDVQLQYRSLQTELRQATERVLLEGPYVLGPEVEGFERAFADYVGVDQAIGVGSGTSALELTLDAQGVGPGDEVIVPALSAAATAMAVLTLGARPVFADVDTGTFNVTAESIGERVTRSTKAVVPVHLYGMPADLGSMSALGLPLIEDAAQAHGSSVNGLKCGSIGIAGAFSFYPTKNLGGYGDGGMVTTSDPDLADRIRLSRNYGQTDRYVSTIQGWNSRLDELQAAILNVKLEKLDGWNGRRRTIANTYRDGLAGLPIRLQEPLGESNYHLFVLCCDRREELRRFLSSHGVPTLVHYPVPLHRQPAFTESNPAPCPSADRLSEQVCSLPIHAQMTDDQVAFVVDRVRTFFEG